MNLSMTFTKIIERFKYEKKDLFIIERFYKTYRKQGKKKCQKLK